VESVIEAFDFEFAQSMKWEKITAKRLREAAKFLNALADKWGA
jgi:hypothetical protein